MITILVFGLSKISLLSDDGFYLGSAKHLLGDIPSPYRSYQKACAYHVLSYFLGKIAPNSAIFLAESPRAIIAFQGTLVDEHGRVS